MNVKDFKHRVIVIEINDNTKEVILTTHFFSLMIMRVHAHTSFYHNYMLYF